jgi:hypothetical protein
METNSPCADGTRLGVVCTSQNYSCPPRYYYLHYATGFIGWLGGQKIAEI